MDLRNSTTDTRSCSNLSAKPLIFGGHRTPQSDLREAHLTHASGEETKLHPVSPAFATETRLRRYNSGNGLDSTATRPPLDMETSTACDMAAAR